MGLIEPLDLEAWKRWQASRHRLRRLRHRWTTSTPEPLVLTIFGDEPHLLVAIDSGSPTSNAALLEPLRHLNLPYALLSSGHRSATTSSASSTSQRIVDGSLPSALGSLRAVSSLGHYMRCGAVAHQWSQHLGVPHVVTQHGALTPFMAPLPPEVHLLAWSEADALFWRSGRSDGGHHVVGSQLLWRAGQGVRESGSRRARWPPQRADLSGPDAWRRAAARPTRTRGRSLLSQARRDLSAPPVRARQAVTSRSRLVRAAGDQVENGTPLAELTNPVVSVFSTGVLEAACQGREAWVDFPQTARVARRVLGALWHAPLWR